MRIVTRAEWHARSPKSTPQRVALSARTATCVHHDGATPVIVTSFAGACARVRADQNYHMDGQHWNDIGYNYLVISAPGVAGVDGLIFEGRGRDILGAHCAGWNTPWIGIQVAIGGTQKPSPAALASVRWLHDTFTTAAGHVLAKKVHSDGLATACPGPELRTWAHAGMPVGVLIAVKVAVVTAVKAVVKKVTPKLPRNIPQTVAIQRAVRVAADGKWGNGTQAAATAVIRRDTSNIRALQGWVGTKVDGVWGPASEAARTATVKAIQRAIGVTADGDFGPLSEAAWLRAYTANYKKF